MKRKSLQVAIDSLSILASLYAGSVLFSFGRDKLLGINSSIQGFEQIGGALGVDPTAFRLFVGLQEVGVAFALFTAVLVLIPKLPLVVQKVSHITLQLGSLGLVGTMVGAIATELSVRPGQQDWLLYLGIRLATIGVFLSAWSFVRFGLPFGRRLALRSPSGSLVA
ncbi:MAG: hypothetical protein AAFQ82_04600 [Myxococcota bacterium]